MYQINENCIACGNCIAECPEGAISEGEIYSINPDVCTDCGACLMGCSVDAIEHVAISPESPNTGVEEELEAFKNTGKYPPSKGDIIPLYPIGYGFVNNITDSGNDHYIVELDATVYDYIGEGCGLYIKQPETMSLSSSDFKRPGESQLKEFRKQLNERNLTFDYGYGRIVYKAITRVPAGDSYYFIDTDMATREATDDRLDSGIHYARFKQGNYFMYKRAADLVGQNVRICIKSYAVQNGNF